MKRVVVLAAIALTFVAGCQPADTGDIAPSHGVTTTKATVESSLSPSATPATTPATTPPTTPATTPATAVPATPTVGAAAPPPPPPAADVPQACGADYYRNSNGVCVHRPVEAVGGAPAGATAKCKDGTYSYSQSRSGTCSHHGGVAVWY